MPGDAGRGVGVDGGGQSVVEAEQFLDAPVRLARNVDDRDDRPAALLGQLRVLGDDSGPGLREAESLTEADLAPAGAMVGTVRVRYDGDEAGDVLTQRGVGRD